LFGDTVNTTARIESTGEKNRIHVSESMANILIKHGKARWLVERKDRVEAKGLGLLRTFWLQTDSMGSVVGSSHVSSSHCSISNDGDDSSSSSSSCSPDESCGADSFFRLDVGDSGAGQSNAPTPQNQAKDAPLETEVWV